MKRRTAAALVVCATFALALGGCEKGKPRHLPPDPFATPPAGADATEGLSAGLSAGLPKLEGQPAFHLDHLGAAADPARTPPPPISAEAPMLLDGFAFDAAARLPALGVDVVIDGKAYGTLYGRKRPDVAAYYKTPGLLKTGFRAILPPGTVGAGTHMVLLRVVASDGKGYYEALGIPFTVE